MWMMVLKILKDNWELVLLGLVILAAALYVAGLKISLNHYKDKAEKIQAEFTLYKNNAEEQARIFRENAAAISKNANEALANKNKVIFEQSIKLAERIKNDKAIRAINVPAASVRLLNESSGTTPTGTTEGTSKEATAGEGSASTSTVNLSVIFEITAENNANHNQCINQVLELQNWYNKLRQGSLAHGDAS